MTPRHHPSTDVLTAYAAGGLEPGFGLVVGAHLEFCAECRAKVGAFEATSGVALRELDPIALAPDAFERMMQQLDEPAPEAPVNTRPLLERLGVRKRKWVVPGLWVAPVETPHAPDNRVYLLGAASGALTALHSHTGAEFCTVLKGSYSDVLGQFAAGDFAATDSDIDHQPRVDSADECICLFATEGRLLARDFLGKLAFRFADV